MFKPTLLEFFSPRFFFITLNFYLLFISFFRSVSNIIFFFWPTWNPNPYVKWEKLLVWALNHDCSASFCPLLISHIMIAIFRPSLSLWVPTFIWRGKEEKYGRKETKTNTLVPKSDPDLSDYLISYNFCLLSFLSIPLPSLTLKLSTLYHMEKKKSRRIKEEKK